MTSFKLFIDTLIFSLVNFNLNSYQIKMLSLVLRIRKLYVSLLMLTIHMIDKMC